MIVFNDNKRNKLRELSLDSTKGRGAKTQKCCLPKIECMISKCRVLVSESVNDGEKCAVVGALQLYSDAARL